MQTDPNEKSDFIPIFTYDRIKAVEYANRFWEQPNPQFQYFEHDDCTNFISQCLWAGGMPMTSGQSRTTGWWYRSQQNRIESWSYSWTVAHSLHWYLRSPLSFISVQMLNRAELLRPGDVIQYDWNGDGKINHSAIVTAVTIAGQPLVNAHTRSAFRRDWRYLDSPAWTPAIRYYFFRIGQITS